MLVPMDESQTAGLTDLSRVPIRDRSIPASVRQDFRALVRTMDLDQALFLVRYCRSRAVWLVQAEMAGQDVKLLCPCTRWQYQAYAAYWQALADRISYRMNPRVG